MSLRGHDFTQQNPKRSIAAEIVMNNFKCELFLVQLILKWRSLALEASATERGKIIIKL